MKVEVLFISRFFPRPDCGGDHSYALGVLQELQRSGLSIHVIRLVLKSGRKRFFCRIDSAAYDYSLSLPYRFRIGKWWLPTLKLISLFIWNGLCKISNIFGAKLNAVGVGPRFWNSPAVDWEIKAINEAVLKYQPRVLLLNYAFLAGEYLNEIPKRIKVGILTHDLLHRRPALEDSYPWTEDLESQKLKCAGCLVAIQDLEAAKFAQMAPNSKVITILPRVSIVESVGSPKAKTVLFVGSVAEHNQDALRNFTDHIWPKILEMEPEVILHVAGLVGPSTLGNNNPPNTVVLGRVPDLTPVYASASVVVAPLLWGTGFKIKLSEAMAHGKSVVATSIAAEGLPEDAPLVIADEAEHFANEVVSLLRSPNVRDSMGKSALEFSQSFFGNKAQITDFLQWVRS